LNAPVELLILGSSGLAREAAQLARQIDPSGQRWHQVSFVVEDGLPPGPRTPYGQARYADRDLSSWQHAADVVIGIGHPQARRRVAQRLAANPHFSFPNLIHPSVLIDSSVVSLGRGNMICKGVVMTCDIVLGDFNLLNWNVTVGHDVTMGSYCVVNPSSNLSGHVRIMDQCLLGTGCQVLEHLTVEAGSVVGAGAVVTRSIQDPGTYVGIPARKVS